MSSVLDQVLLEDIAKFCPVSFLSFHQCMLTDKDCNEEQAVLAKCIKTKVPSFEKIHTKCDGLLRSYESCLTKNESDTAKCKSELEALRSCSFDAVKS